MQFLIIPLVPLSIHLMLKSCSMLSHAIDPWTRFEQWGGKRRGAFPIRTSSSRNRRCFVPLRINTNRTCLDDARRHLDNNVPRFPGCSAMPDVKFNYRRRASRVKGDVERNDTRGNTQRITKTMRYYVLERTASVLTESRDRDRRKKEMSKPSE